MNNYGTYYYSKYFEENKINIKTASLHPGVVRTDILKSSSNLFYIAKFLVYPIYYFLSKSNN